MPALPRAAPLGPGHASLHRAPRILSPTAEGAERERDRCQPCPWELGSEGAKDGAQPACCPPPPPLAGKMLLSPYLPARNLLPPHRPAAACTARFLRSDFSISWKGGKSKRRTRHTKGPGGNSCSPGAWQGLTMPLNQRGHSEPDPPESSTSQ